MTDKPQKKKKSWFSRLFMIVICAGIFFAIIFTVLANIGGNSEPLKQSVEQYLTDATPYVARVGTLNHMNFFPSVIVDFNNLELMPDGLPTAEPLIRVQKSFMAASFWDVITHSGKVNAIHISYLYALPGSLFKNDFTLSDLSILTNETADEAILKAEGKIAATPFFAIMGLEISGTFPHNQYRIGKEKKIEAGLGDYRLNAIMRDANEGIDIHDILIKKDQDLLSGNLRLRRIDNKITIQGKLKAGENGTELTLDLQIAKNDKILEIVGVIKTSSFHEKDFAENSALNTFIKTFINSFTLPEGKGPLWNVTIETPAGQRPLLVKDGTLILGRS